MRIAFLGSRVDGKETRSRVGGSPRGVGNGVRYGLSIRSKRPALHPRLQGALFAPGSQRVGRNAEVLSDPLRRTPAAEQKIDGFLPEVVPIGGACLQFFLG